jgi:hypothetical protein
LRCQREQLRLARRPAGQLDGQRQPVLAVDERQREGRLAGEETGLRARLVRELPSVEYEVRGRTKLVRYWLTYDCDKGVVSAAA